jgi:hypothetical protein
MHAPNMQSWRRGMSPLEIPAHHCGYCRLVCRPSSPLAMVSAGGGCVCNITPRCSSCV